MPQAALGQICPFLPHHPFPKPKNSFAQTFGFRFSILDWEEVTISSLSHFRTSKEEEKGKQSEQLPKKTLRGEKKERIDWTWIAHAQSAFTLTAHASAVVTIRTREESREFKAAVETLPLLRSNRHFPFVVGLPWDLFSLRPVRTRDKMSGGVLSQASPGAEWDKARPGGGWPGKGCRLRPPTLGFAAAAFGGSRCLSPPPVLVAACDLRSKPGSNVELGPSSDSRRFPPRP